MNLERITTLLAQGLKPAQVASIVGITPARISQLAKESTEFQNLLALKQAEQEKEDIEETALSAKYHAAEHTLLDQVLQMAPMSELRDVTAALRVVAERQEKMKTRQAPVVNSQPVLQQVIQISLPSQALQVPTLSMTKDREVISIDSLNLAPLTSQGVTNLFESMRKGKENEPTGILTEAVTVVEEAKAEL